MIYHIAKEEEWEENRNNNFYSPARFTRDGFIHCSTREQVKRTANSLFTAYAKVFLLCINDEKEKAFIKYENLEGGKELFPHIYRKIPKDSILKVVSLSKTGSGFFDFSELD